MKDFLGKPYLVQGWSWRFLSQDVCPDWLPSGLTLLAHVAYRPGQVPGPPVEALKVVTQLAEQHQLVPSHGQVMVATLAQRTVEESKLASEGQLTIQSILGDIKSGGGTLSWDLQSRKQLASPPPLMAS